MHRFVSKVTEKTDKLSNEQLRSVINNLLLENEILSEENYKLESIFESLSSGLLIVNEEYSILHCNSIAQRFLGFSLSEDISYENKPVWELTGEDEISEFLKNCAEKKITNASEDFSVLTEGESVRFLSVAISPLFQDNNLKGLIITVKDITGKKNQDVLLHRMENMASLTNLAAGMAHEIKNPLGAISIHIQLVQKALEKARQSEDKLPPKKFLEDHIDVVNEEIQHLNSLVMDFLFAVRPINAVLELKDPVVVIQNVRDFFEPEFNKSGVKFETECFEKQKIMADEKLFKQVLINMAQNSLNAIQSRQEKEGKNFTGVMCIKTKVKDGKYFILISDNGIGMSDNTVSKIFEPYYTTKANGTGLGMTMVYKIVKEFSGDISVKSVEGEGTKFVLSFPLPQDETKLLR
ncbi:MAG: PAS domain S-box protein [Treponema sp.]|nr:PAS domain S-box protein [Treponema sp.]